MDIFDNKNIPFTVPDRYFDNLQGRVMSNIRAREVNKKSFRLTPLRMWLAVAACVLLLFTVGGALVYTNKQPVITTTLVNEDHNMHDENINELCDEDQAIIDFLERDNISVAAIIHTLNNSY